MTMSDLNIRFIMVINSRTAISEVETLADDQAAAPVEGSPTERIKMHVFYTESHALMLEHCLAPSAGHSFALVEHRAPQLCASARYGSPGWKDTICAKLRAVCAALEDSSEPFVFCDPDILLNNLNAREIAEYVRSASLAAQAEPNGELCSGFIIMNPDITVRTLFREALALVQEGSFNFDQQAINHVLKIRGIRPVFLSTNSYLCAGSVMPAGGWNGDLRLVDRVPCNFKSSTQITL